MSTGSYFVSQEAENAATDGVIKRYKAAKEATAALENQMSELSEKLSTFATVLKHPKDYRFLPTSYDLTVGQAIKEGDSPKRPVVVLQATDLDLKHVSEMVVNYEKARTDKVKTGARLHDMGLDLKD